MQVLPLTSPQFLSDAIFTQYGFFTGSASHAQLQAAYTIAEYQVALECGTYLLPTTITGTVSFPIAGEVLKAPVGKLISINSVVFYEKYAADVDRLISGTARIVDYEGGQYVLDISPLDNSVCAGCNVLPNSVLYAGIYKADICLTAGYPTGTIAAPNLQLALCMAADIALQQIIDRGMGFEYETFQTTIQIGRSIVTNDRRTIRNTAFGPSARAQYITNLLSGYKIYRPGKLS